MPHKKNIMMRVLVLALAAPLAAQAQSFRCVAKDGKRYYGSVIPPECVGRLVEQLNAQGMVIKRIDPQGAEKERLAKEADEARKREEEAAARETMRRNRALLATYTSEKDIEDARTRALADNEKAVRQIELRVDELRRRQGSYEKELEFYKGANKPPAKLAEDIHNVRLELQAAQDSLDSKKKEVESINAKYDEDKKRYAELTRR